MGRTWLKVEVGVLDHPKVCALAEAFGVDPADAVAFLLRWWGYCAEFASRGQSADCPQPVLRRFAESLTRRSTLALLPDVAETLRRLGLMDDDGHPHDWQVYTGSLVTRRARDAARQRLHRLGEACHADSPSDVTVTSRTQSRDRVEKKKRGVAHDVENPKSSPEHVREAMKRALAL